MMEVMLFCTLLCSLLSTRRHLIVKMSFIGVYFFFPRGTLEESSYMFQLLGLNLLSLLAQNRLAEFHTVSKNTHYL